MILKRIVIFLGIIFLLLAMVLSTLFIALKNIKAKELIEREIEQELGIKVTIEKLEFSPLLTLIRAKGVTIHNPPGFDEKELAYVNSIDIVWDPIDVIIHKKPNIYLMVLDLERLNIIKNNQGQINLKELIPIKEGNVQEKDETPFYFDLLILSVAEIHYTEYTATLKKVHTYTIGMKNQVFVKLNDEKELIRLVITKAIQNTDIGKLVNLTIAPVASDIAGTINTALGTAKTGARGVFETVSMPFKMLFGK